VATFLSTPSKRKSSQRGLQMRLVLVRWCLGQRQQYRGQPSITCRLGIPQLCSQVARPPLRNTSNFRQYFTGNANGHTVVLPVASTMVLGQAFEIYNRSDGPSFTVNTSGGNGLVSVGYLLGVRVTCILTSGTGIASWDTAIIGSQLATGSSRQVFELYPSLTGSPYKSSRFSYSRPFKRGIYVDHHQCYRQRHGSPFQL
jgi:hypothetical protein